MVIDKSEVTGRNYSTIICNRRVFRMSERCLATCLVMGDMSCELSFIMSAEFDDVMWNVTDGIMNEVCSMELGRWNLGM